MEEATCQVAPTVVEETSDPSTRELARVEWFLLGAGILLLLWRPYLVFGDGLARYYGLQQMLELHQWPTIRYSVLSSLYLLPFYLVGKVVGSPAWWCARADLIIFLAWLAGMAWLLREKVPERVRVLFLLLMVSASMLPIYVITYNIEVVTTCFTTLGLLLVCCGRPVWGWGLVAVAGASVPPTAAGVLASALVLAVQERRWRHLLPVLVTATLILVENSLRHGNPLQGGYAGDHGVKTFMPYSALPGFSYPFVLGLVSIIFSFGKGIVWFFPGIALAPPTDSARPEVRTALWTWWAYLAGLVLLYSKWWGWNGGAAWGPRFFIVASVPAALMLALRIHHAPRRLLSDAATIAALALSVWVCVDGQVLPDLPPICLADNFAWESLGWFVPEFSPLWFPFLAQSWNLDLQKFLTLCYGGLTALVLVLPVVARIARSAAPAVKDHFSGGVRF